MTAFYSFDVSATDAEVSVIVNGVPVEVFTSGQSGGGPMNAWMINGANEIAFELKPVGDNPRASAGIDLSGPDGYETLASFSWPEQEGPAVATVKVEGFPAWSWLRGEAVSGAAAEVTGAVAALHTALEPTLDYQPPFCAAVVCRFTANV